MDRREAPTTLRRDLREVDAAIAALRGRAASLCADADEVHPLVARAYRRRAEELALAAWVGEIVRGRTPGVLDPCGAAAA